MTNLDMSHKFGICTPAVSSMSAESIRYQKGGKMSSNRMEYEYILHIKVYFL